MSNYTQATLSDVNAAGIARLATYAQALDIEIKKEWRDEQAIADLEWRLIDLRFGLERAATEPDLERRDVNLGYLQETHRLLEAFVDPLLRPLLPPVPVSGSLVKPLIWAFNGNVITFNGNLVGVGAVLVPVAGVTYNTLLLPAETAGTVTFGGLPQTEFGFDGPAPTTGRPIYLRLYVGNVQVGRIDFTDPLLGAGFSLLYDGVTYYGTFQETTTNILVLD